MHDAAPRDDASIADLAAAVVALAREIESRHEHADYIPLTQTERLVLGTLDRHGESAPGALAERLGMQRSNLSTALRGLEAKALVARRRSSPDGRGVLVSSTPLAAENLSRLRARWAEVLEAVTPEELDVASVADSLHEMTQALIEQRRSRS
ncbi:MarR family winged helix-turn-helix transcriptional regulator [Leucobacter sp. L43]|uniref:MarR family winged helix-turn-helix transcriptional regulator n=1 Tax=Leucobacter sp. L43 TaxID=2798040 RepID=UPI0019035D73|nr:MarR family transcriptional regulator [Leucobacter sp. L43]